MSEITRRSEWDGTFSLLLDGQVVLERKPFAEIEEKEAFLRGRLALHRIAQLKVEMDGGQS